MNNDCFNEEKNRLVLAPQETNRVYFRDGTPLNVQSERVYFGIYRVWNAFDNDTKITEFRRWVKLFSNQLLSLKDSSVAGIVPFMGVRLAWFPGAD